MAGAQPDDTPYDGVTLSLSPSGALRLSPRSAGDPALDATSGPRIAAAFSRGTGDGLLHLGAVEVETALPPVFGFFRDLGRRFVTRLCGAPDLETQRARLELPVPLADLRAWALSAPPLDGAEYLTDESIAALWSAALDAFRAAVGGFAGTVEAWLRGQSPLWHLVGRIHFHLAENKSDVERPFAFLATYTTKLSAAAKVQHLPLGRALGAFANDRDALLALLAPVERAAGASPLVKELADSRQVFKQLAWTPAEALRFLREVPALEAAGVVVRVPDWWGGRSRVAARATIGKRQPSGLGLDALLDFSIDVALDGEPLTTEELARLRAAGAGLVSLRGRWVEIDAAKLDEMVARLGAVQHDLGEGGLSLREAMRMLAGGGEAATGGGEWGEVEAGAWLGRTLEALRRPESLATLDAGDAAGPSDAIDFGAHLAASLRPYQQVGVRWLHFLVGLGLGACLADDMGLGKTVQVIALLVVRRLVRRSAGPRPDLLVVPASLVGNWMAELSRFAPALRTFVAHPSVTPKAELAKRPALDDVDLVITTYGSLLRYPWLAEAEWGLVIADEAQAIKNAGARQSRALKALDARGGRIALTGTPVENRLGELHSLFEFVNPGLLGTRRAFDDAVKRMAADPARRYAPLRELVSPYILRRLKSDRRVIADLPDKTELRAWCSLTSAQAALYQQAVEDLARTLREKSSDDKARRGAVLGALMRFKQICNHPSQWLGDGRFAGEASGKHARLMEIAEEAGARQDKLLVFTQFREMTQPIAAWLAERLGRAGLVLHGETPVKERRGLVDRFQSDEGLPFMVLSLKAGGTGLNLTAASHVVHFDRWWNPAVEDQATDRAYRIGQHRNVLVHKFIVRGTLEEKIDALIESKRTVAGEVIGGGDGAAALLTELPDAELLRLVSLDLDRAIGE